MTSDQPFTVVAPSTVHLHFRGTFTELGSTSGVTSMEDTRTRFTTSAATPSTVRIENAFDENDNDVLVTGNSPIFEVQPVSKLGGLQVYELRYSGSAHSEILAQDRCEAEVARRYEKGLREIAARTGDLPPCPSVEAMYSILRIADAARHTPATRLYKTFTTGSSLSLALSFGGDSQDTAILQVKTSADIRVAGK